MNAKQFTNMIQDRHFYNLKKMQYKYSQGDVCEMLEILRNMMYENIAIKDFKRNDIAYIPSKINIASRGLKQLLMARASNEKFGVKAMEDEIYSTFSIENINSSRDSVRKILKGYAPSNEEEDSILGMRKGIEFISDKQNKITEENLYKLYMLTVGNYLGEQEKLKPNSFYRHDRVYVVGGKVEHEGISYNLLPEYMAEFVKFINEKDELNELIKACIIHFYIAYLHPYFDGNGRTARLVQMWYLVQQGYSSTMFIPFSKYINDTKKDYYNSYIQIEENQKISGMLDVTPFILYFTNNVYNKISNTQNENPIFEIFDLALENGEITEKEKKLWQFILSVYSENEFSTKQLEKDFGNAAYATIRNFVLKFEKLGLLTSQKYSNRVKYKIKF